MKTPAITHAAAVYPDGVDYQDGARISKYGDTYNLYRESEEGVYVPRALAPLGHNDERTEGRRVGYTSTFLPRNDEQRRLVTEADAELQQGSSFILQAPTGIGKTAMSMELIKRVGRRTLVVVTKEDVRDQWIDACKAFLGLSEADIGVLQANKVPAHDTKVVIASIQSLSREGKYSRSDFLDYGLTIVDECFTSDTELLTPDGWVPVNQVFLDTKVMQCSTTGELTYTYPSKLIRKPFEGELVRFSNTNFDFLATPNHQHLVYWGKQKEPRKVAYKDINPKNRYSHRSTGTVVGDITPTTEDLFRVAYEADGTYLHYRKRDGKHCVRFSFRRQRKIDRLLALVSELGYEHKTSVNKRGDTNIVVWLRYVPAKDLDWIPLTLPSTYYREVLQEIVLWDGWIPKMHGALGMHQSYNLGLQERVQQFAALAGYLSKLNICIKAKGKEAYRVAWYNGSVRSMKGCAKTYVPHKGRVYCVRVPEGNLLVRHNGKIGVTGNCHRIGADQFSQAMWLLPARLRLGLSATPERSDGKDEVLQGHIGRIKVVGRSLPMIPTVVIRNTKFPPPKWPDGSPMQHTYGKTIHVDKLLAKNHARNDYIAKFVAQALVKDRKVIVFASTKAHLENLRNVLLTKGIDSDRMALYVGGLSKAGRLKAQEKPVLLATYSFTSEATDIPALDTCVLATPRSDVVQIVGRILRQHPGKKPPIVLDLVDNSSRIFAAYATKRRKWYADIGARII